LRNFWIFDAVTDERREITARLRMQTSRVAMWVEEGAWHDVRRLERAAERFETDSYPRIHAAFGSEWTPGIDQDPRINILHATGLAENVLGYTSPLDAFPSDVHPWSNHAEMITVNLDVVDVGSSAYDALLARQLVRLIQWHEDRNEERWVREGLAYLASVLVGSDVDQLCHAYLQQMDTPLIAWRDDKSQRGAALLFMTYFHQRFGDAGTRALTAEPTNGTRGFEAVLRDLETGLTFDDLFADWLTANYLDSTLKTDDSPYTYPGLDLPQPTAAAVYDTYPVEVESSVHQLGAHVIVLRGEEDLRVQFKGQAESSFLTGIPQSGHPVWWSNRADGSLTTLARRFDLREVEQATLTYRVWYDIEPHYDYVTVEVSADGGEQWQILPAPSGTGADPHGNNPGWGYTGSSDGWSQEEISLSDYAGGEILVRFSYLTDATITGEGLLLDDVSVPEIARGQERQGSGTESTWNARGFVLTDGRVPQDYVALLIGGGDGVKVERLPLADDRSAVWTVPLGTPDPQEAVLIISAMAPLARQPAAYQLQISR
jgi:hypothetical protein